MLNAKDLARLGLMVAILEVSKLALASLPNIELVSFWIILFTLTIGYRALYAVYGFVLLEGILYGHTPLVGCVFVCMDASGIADTTLPHAAISMVLEHSFRPFWAMLRRLVRLALLRHRYSKRRLL